ncbi:MAG: 50S ribosomal protein L3 [Alphaproteobacteria bacterium]
MRTGVIAEKLGMVQFFTKEGKHVGVTVLKVSQCMVTGQRTQSKNGYTALQIGAFKPKNMSKPVKGYFSANKLEPYKFLREFRVEKDCLLDVGTLISVDHFEEGQYVDVTGKTIGKGFAGCIKRHNFKGLRASHGVSVSHRSHGSTGNRQDPGRVFKNKKMAGRMGMNRVTKLNLIVFRVDKERGLLFLKGAVPGSKGSLVSVRDAIKKRVNQ